MDARGNQDTTQSTPSAVAAIQSPNELPDRYALRDVEGEGNVRVLICHESVNLSVQITPGQTVSNAAARKAAPGTIFLDGAAKGEPFLDHERRVYNFDHHEGVIRAFTLATCEQALMMLRKGLDLRENKWRVVANQPDLDTVLAIWVLLNHTRLTGKESKVRTAITPLLRLEGLIDGQGLELVDFSGFPSSQQTQLMGHLKKLQTEEQRLRQTLGDEPDAELAFVHGMLRRIDRMVYHSSDFEDFQPFEELAHVDLGEQKVAVACRSEAGIYELEGQLKNVYGARLGLIALEKKPGTYTVRATALLVAGRMQAIYERLNCRDPFVVGRRPENRWGGAAEIGGSPRETGSGLSPRDVLETAREVFTRPGVFFYARQALGATSIVALIMVAGWLMQRYWPWGGQGSQVGGLLGERAFGFLLTTSVLTVSALVWLVQKTRDPLRFGFALPAGWDWLLLVPVAVLAAWGGRIWSSPVSGETSWPMLCCLLLMSVPMELLFRGLLMGLLSPGCLLQSAGGRWFLSWPVLGSAVLYMLFFGMPDGVLLGAEGFHTLAPSMIGRLGAGLVFGLAVGMIRERSESVGAAVLAHAVAVLAVLNAANG